MALSDELVIEFQKLFEEKTGQEIDLKAARKCADDVVELFSVLADIDRKEKEI